MAGKHTRERWRYVAFRIEGDTPFARNDFLSSLLRATRGSSFYDAFRMTVFEGDFGILKVRHRFKQDAIDALSGLDSVLGRPCKVVTLKTSGTIKTLKEKYKDQVSRGDDRTGE